MATKLAPALIQNSSDRLSAMTPWGNGTPRREFLHVDDLADATLFALRHYDGDDHLNVGTGSDVAISDLAELIAKIVGYEGEFVYDTSMPDGTPRRLLDVSRMAELGWSASIGLEEGIEATYEWYLDNHVTAAR